MCDYRTHPRAFFVLLCLSVTAAWSEPVPVRHLQGSAHGFLEIKTLAGVRIATGDYMQTVKGNQVTSRVLYHFVDGSIDDEVTTYSQNSSFHLISNHHIQRGPTFPQPLDVLIDVKSGTITSRKPDGKVEQEHLDMPADVANGLAANLLVNILPSSPETIVSYVAPTAKPSLVRISIKPSGEVRFKVGGTPRKATDYVLHVELGGLEGVVAPVIGKQPRDFHILVMGGMVPALIREEGQFYERGPVWRVEQISPVFSR